MNLWREQAAYFASRTRVLLVDLPGHGLSDKAHVPYSMRLFATALRGVMNDARVDRAILVAHSMGTPIARQFDRQYHDRTRGIATLDGAL